MNKFIPKASLNIIGAPIWLGKSKSSGNAFREMLTPAMISEIHKKRTFDTYETNSRSNLFHIVKKNTSDFMVTIGGDHSITIGTVGANLAMNKRVGLIWIDQHPPVSHMDVIKNGNEHGVPLLQLKHEQPCVLKFPRLDPSKIIHIGASFKTNGIASYMIQDVIEKGSDTIALECKLKLKECDHIHVVFDIDVMDKKYCACTEHVSQNGMYLFEAKSFLRGIRKHFEHSFRALDIVEIDTTMGTHDEFEKTLETARQLVYSSL